jgi:hypothetical protein
MLYDGNGLEMTHIPHQDKCDRWREELDEEDFNEAVASINEYIDNSVGSFTANVIAESDWTETPYHALLYPACNDSQEDFRELFWQIVWHVLMERKDDWTFSRPDKNLRDLKEVTFFRRNV